MTSDEDNTPGTIFFQNFNDNDNIYGAARSSLFDFPLFSNTSFYDQDAFTNFTFPWGDMYDYSNQAQMHDAILDTFYNNLLSTSSAFTVVLITLYSLAFVIGLLGNCTVIIVVLSKKQMRTVTNTFLVGMIEFAYCPKQTCDHPKFAIINMRNRIIELVVKMCTVITCKIIRGDLKFARHIIIIIIIFI